MSVPLKHHYLPEFYLKRWRVSPDDARVIEYRRPHPQKPLVIKKAYPSETGFGRELYAIQSRSEPKARQELESEFMSPLDSRAANALGHLEAYGTRPADAAIADAWSRFVLSLLNRNPTRVAWLRSKLIENDNKTLAKIEQNYESLRRPEDPTTFEEYRKASGSELVDENQALLIKRMIGSPWLGTHISGMHWHVHKFDRPKHGLITGDEPLMTSNGIGAKYGFLLMPIGPDRVFFAANDPAVIASFTDQPTKLESGFNDAVARQSKILVVANSDRHRAFVEKRLGRLDASGGLLERQTWAAPLRDA